MTHGVCNNENKWYLTIRQPFTMELTNIIDGNLKMRDNKMFKVLSDDKTNALKLKYSGSVINTMN